MRTVADRHILAAYHNKHCWRAFRFLPTSMTLNDQDNLRMKCSALNVDFNGVRFDPLASWSPPYECIKFGYPLENVRFLLLSTSTRTVADKHRLDAYHNKHCWRAFRGYQHRWPWTTLNPQNMGFKWIFRYFSVRWTLRVNFRWNILEIVQYNLRTKRILNWCCRASHEH